MNDEKKIFEVDFLFVFKLKSFKICKECYYYIEKRLNSKKTRRTLIFRKIYISNIIFSTIY